MQLTAEQEAFGLDVRDFSASGLGYESARLVDADRPFKREAAVAKL